LKKKSVTKSLKKGKTFELWVSKWLKSTFNCEARRGQQYSGTETTHDIKTDLPLAIECKRTESINCYRFLNQAKEEAHANEIPVVIHKKNHHEPIIILELSNLAKISQILAKLVK
jgi:hypothetical protein